MSFAQGVNQVTKIIDLNHDLKSPWNEKHINVPWLTMYMVTSEIKLYHILKLVCWRNKENEIEFETKIRTC